MYMVQLDHNRLGNSLLKPAANMTRTGRSTYLPRHPSLTDVQVGKCGQSGLQFPGDMWNIVQTEGFCLGHSKARFRLHIDRRRAAPRF